MMKPDNQQGDIEKIEEEKGKDLLWRPSRRDFCRQICELGKEGKKRKGRGNGDLSYPSSSGSSSRSRGAEQQQHKFLRLRHCLSFCLSVCLSKGGWSLRVGTQFVGRVLRNRARKDRQSTATAGLVVTRPSLKTSRTGGSSSSRYYYYY